MSKLLKPEKYADLMGWKPSTVYNRRNKGDFLPGLVVIKSPGKRPTIRFDLQAVEKWLEEQLEEQQAERR